MSERTLDRAERVVRSLRKELERRYGWTLLEVELVADEERGALYAKGTVVAPRVTERLAAVLSDLLPETWRLDVTGLRALRTGDWRALVPGQSAVWQKLSGHDRVLATEWRLDDGPVELLASAKGSSLVRGMDATVGWIDAELHVKTEAPRIEPAHGTIDEVVAVARSFVGAPYRLGGASEHGLDCSGLVQRSFKRAMGVLLPRHSTDQLQATLHVHSAPRRDGDLVFAWTEREGPCHVGVLAANDSSTVVHASQSRRSVLEDPLERFLEKATRMEFVPISSVLAHHAGNVGRPALELPLIEEGNE